MKVTVIRSNRKTVAIQVNSDLGVTVRAPRSALEKDIEEILKKKEARCLHYFYNYRLVPLFLLLYNNHIDKIFGGLK